MADDDEYYFRIWKRVVDVILLFLITKEIYYFYSLQVATVEWSIKGQ